MRGVELDSIVKLGVFRAENALEATDSDPRFQLVIPAHSSIIFYKLQLVFN
jgi:hypothetical protein